MRLQRISNGFTFVLSGGKLADYDYNSFFFPVAAKSHSTDEPPPYTSPAGPMYQAPPPAYTPSQNGYYGWMPPMHAFPDAPPGKMKTTWIIHLIGCYCLLYENCLVVRDC